MEGDASRQVMEGDVSRRPAPFDIPHPHRYTQRFDQSDDGVDAKAYERVF
jgi:hypothetical protein